MKHLHKLRISKQLWYSVNNSRNFEKLRSHVLPTFRIREQLKTMKMRLSSSTCLSKLYTTYATRFPVPW